MTRRFLRSGLALLVTAVACGGSSDDGGKGSGGSGGADASAGSGGAGGTAGVPEQTGRSCEAPSDCYPAVEAGALSGEVVCLDRVTDGYCTHLCETDDDCCAAPGECETDLRQVCSPFESTGMRFCFLSCEDEDLRPADAGAPDSATPDVDPGEYCRREAHEDFICRSSGGGSKNRKVCVPGGGGGQGGQGGQGGAGAGGVSGADAGTSDAGTG